MSLQYIRTSTDPNAAYTRLLYTVSGSIYTAQPQFQYVLDVYENGGDLLKRMTQPVNPAGTATFDIARVVQGELKADYNWKINSVTQFDSSSKTFLIQAGEQFGTSISSSVTVYPDQANEDLISWQGVVEPNAGTYNWTDIVDSQVLSNMPATMSMQSDDFGTISVYNDQGTFISQSFYSGDILVDQKNYSTSGSYFNAVPISSSNQNWTHVDVSISSSFGTEAYRYEVSDETHREKTRFAFVNKLGAWDYYNNYNPVRQAINVTREQYTAPRVDYSTRTSIYDISRRGKKDYHNSTDDIFTVDTDLLDKENANWLEELIESPEVYIQRNGEFIPIVITDSSYVSNQNQARQKLFKYTINFKPSNQPFGTWVPEYVQCPQPLESFDPTLDGEVSPYFWYDFTDTSSMIVYGTGSNEYQGIVSKGTNSGSLERGTTAKYSSSYWTPFVAEYEYSTFNNIPGKNSSIARRHGTGNYVNDDVFNIADSFTAISFTQPIYSDNGVTVVNRQTPLISFKTPEGSDSDSPEEITFLGVGDSGSIDTSSGTRTVDFVSTDTTNFISMSYFEFEAPDVFPPTLNRDFVLYSYNGTAGGWQSSYQVYNSGSNNTLKVGREPISSSQNYETGSAIFQAYVQTPGELDTGGLTIGTRALEFGFNVTVYEFNISHFIVYGSVLTNEQIQRVIDSYKGSTTIPFNTFEN